MIPASVEHGLTEVTAASMLATMGVFDLIGTTGSGWLSDRIDPRKLLVWYYTFRGIALLFLPAAYDAGVPALAAFVVFHGLDWVATVPPTVQKRTSLKILSEVITSKNRECCTSKNPALQSLVAD